MKGVCIMDNQYNYYNPGSDDQNIWDEQPGGKQPKKKGNGGSKKWLSIISGGLVFGIVACAAFQAGNVIVDRATGDDAKEVRQTSTATQLNQTSSTVTSDVSGIVEQAMPSIVSITNMSVQEVQSFFGQTQEQESESLGSGIIVQQSDTELLIATNNHVVEGADSLTVSFIDNQAYEANIKGTDSANDLAVIAVPLSSISADTMSQIRTAALGDSDSLRVGEQVVAIGNALGYGQSVTTGIVSATNRVLTTAADNSADSTTASYIQTDAAINPGNSGGALVNMRGEVIGINSAKLASTEVEGMGYAIPITRASSIINTLMNESTLVRVDEANRGSLGITATTVPSSVTEAYGIPTGVYVSDVTAGSAAESAGLRRGDVITAVDGRNVTDVSGLQDLLQYYSAGQTVTLTVQSITNGSYAEKTVSLTLEGSSASSNTGVA